MPTLAGKPFLDFFKGHVKNNEVNVQQSGKKIKSEVTIFALHWKPVKWGQTRFWVSLDSVIGHFSWFHGLTMIPGSVIPRSQPLYLYLLASLFLTSPTYLHLCQYQYEAVCFLRGLFYNGPYRIHSPLGLLILTCNSNVFSRTLICMPEHWCPSCELRAPNLVVCLKDIIPYQTTWIWNRPIWLCDSEILYTLYSDDGETQTEMLLRVRLNQQV